MIQIEGAKIKLRDWQVEDIPEFSHWIQPHHQWHDLDGPYYKITESEAKEKIDVLQAQIKEGKFTTPRYRLVIADLKTNKLLGTVSSYWESKETNWLCAGVTLYSPETWGKGIGFEALSLWIDYLFEQHTKIVRLDLRTWSGNQGMMKLAEKLGFKKEACFRKARIVANEYYDSIGYGILREEWVNQRRRTDQN